MRVGDLCLLDVESSDVARQYAEVLQVFFVDGQEEQFAPEAEPAIREAVEAYRANPSTHNRRITAAALNETYLQFLCSDVLAYGLTETSSPEYHLLYPLRLRMFEVQGQLFYEAHEANILGVLCLKTS